MARRRTNGKYKIKVHFGETSPTMLPTYVYVENWDKMCPYDIYTRNRVYKIISTNNVLAETAPKKLSTYIYFEN
jgi:hypothetical protein